MAWPTLNGSELGIRADGVTSIRWGTHGFLNSPAPGGAAGYYVVTRFGQKSLVENTKLPNGIGLTSTRVQLIDGVEFTITVRDDTGMTPPRIGTLVSIVDAAGMLGTYTPGTAYPARIIDNNYEAAPKQPGERMLVAERLVLIEGA